MVYQGYVTESESVARERLIRVRADRKNSPIYLRVRYQAQTEGECRSYRICEIEELD